MAQFNQDFLWGAGTSSHQVEGNTHNHWTEWELENATSLSKQALYHYGELDSWPHIKVEAERPATYISGEAANFYNLYERDIAALSKIGLNSIRVGVEWARVQPAEDSWDPKAVKHYKDVLMSCEKYNIVPVIVFFHTSLPVWFSDKGGFTKRSNITYFVSYCERMASEFGRHARFILTMYEPDVYASMSYLHGDWPPAISSKATYSWVYMNLIAAHRQTYAALKKLQPSYQVSISKQATYFFPGDSAKLSHISAGVAQFVSDDIFWRLVFKKTDYMAVSINGSHRIYGYRIHDKEDNISATGASLCPADVEYTLIRLADSYKQPILITGGSMADTGTDGDALKDAQRVWWLEETINGLIEAQKNGVVLRGYIYGNLLDSYEWEKGSWPKNGLLSVNPVSKARKPKASAVWLARFLRRSAPQVVTTKSIGTNKATKNIKTAK